MVNWLATLLVTPRPLPRMDFSRGHRRRSRARWWWSRRCSTSAEDIESLVEALEVRFLANRDAHLHFGLLTDFRGRGRRKRCPGTSRCCGWRAQGIEALNAKYGRAAGPGGDGAAGDTFFLFHRPRRWNPQERVWMGYERKRGKLADLNALLRGGGSGALLARRRRRPRCCRA